jgi:hypothetical protein
MTIVLMWLSAVLATAAVMTDRTSVAGASITAATLALIAWHRDPVTGIRDCHEDRVSLDELLNER